jgi:hypothetical protein
MRCSHRLLGRLEEGSTIVASGFLGTVGFLGTSPSVFCFSVPWVSLGPALFPWSRDVRSKEAAGQEH